jgi:rhamnogalacturonan endolyase
MNNSTTKSKERLLAHAAKIFFFCCFAICLLYAGVYGQKKVEKLGRGVVAIRSSPTSVFISWRLLGTEPSNLAFNIYRGSSKLNATPITGGTNYIDAVSTNETYRVAAVVNGVEQPADPSAMVNVWAATYKQVPIPIPASGVTPVGEAYTYSANDGSVGDLDGDGEYEIILKWDPSNSKSEIGFY